MTLNSDRAIDSLAQFTAVVLVDNQPRGTAWLLSEDGFLLTAGHILGLSNPLSSVHVRFPEDVPRIAHRIHWEYQPLSGSDFAVLKLESMLARSTPLPIALPERVSGEFRLRGYGISLIDQSEGRGTFVGTYEPQNFSGNRLFVLRSSEIGEKGYSGAAVFSERYGAVVAIQIEATTARTGPGRDTILAMPLYRIAQKWQLLRDLAVPPSPEKFNEFQFLSAISNNLLKEIGRKRTAYPTDMNFGELFERGVFIPPRLSDPSNDDHKFMEHSNFIANLKFDSNILVIGEPGSGKSFFAFLIQRNLVLSESEINDGQPICISIDLKLFLDASANSKTSLSYDRFLEILVENYWDGVPLQKRSAGKSKLYFIVDGIDELSTTPRLIPLLGSLLDDLSTLGGILVTCRTRDYEHVFSTYLNPSLFQETLRLEKWRVEVEFERFLKLLGNEGLFQDTQLFTRVLESDALRALAARPLYARMLTFVSRPGIDSIRTITHLYREYLSKFATVVDRELIKQECLTSANTYQLWRSIAWHVFQSDIFVHDKIPFSAINRFLVTEFSIGTTCVPRLLQPLFNFVQVFHIAQLQYVHFSFFEYLVAEQMADLLTEAHLDGNRNAFSLFEKDMTPEIRHHLMQILRETHQPNFGHWLAEVYVNNAKFAPTIERKRVANNLLVYILGRIEEDSSNELWDLLKNETDPFLTTCLYWGLTAKGGVRAVEEYISILAKDAEMRSLNQGYLLYYYGDLDRSKAPPYLDDEPKRSWSNTKRRTLDLMSAPHYHVNVPIGRQIIDLYTFYDFCIFRDEVVSRDELRILSKVLKQIESQVSSEYIMRRLDQMHGLVKGS